MNKNFYNPRLNENEKLFDKRIKSLLKKIEVEYALSISNILNSRQVFSHNLALTKLFEMILSSHGSVVECGSYRGNGLGLFEKLSSVLEPTNINRKIISFDTFNGFPSVSKNELEFVKEGMLNDVNFELLKEAVAINNLNRVNGHIDKIEFIVGDANATIPKYVSDNPHLIISLLYLDFDVYEATKIALKYFLPLVTKGGIVAFDELAQKKWQGESIAFKEVLKVNKIKLKRFTFEPHVSYFIMGE